MSMYINVCSCQYLPKHFQKQRYGGSPPLSGNRRLLFQCVPLCSLTLKSVCMISLHGGFMRGRKQSCAKQCLILSLNTDRSSRINLEGRMLNNRIELKFGWHFIVLLLHCFLYTIVFSLFTAKQVERPAPHRPLMRELQSNISQAEVLVMLYS